MTVYIIFEMKPGGLVDAICAFSKPESAYKWIEDNKNGYGALWSQSMWVEE